MTRNVATLQKDLDEKNNALAQEMSGAPAKAKEALAAVSADGSRMAPFSAAPPPTSTPLSNHRAITGQSHANHSRQVHAAPGSATLGRRAGRAIQEGICRIVIPKEPRHCRGGFFSPWCRLRGRRRGGGRWCGGRWRPRCRGLGSVRRGSRGSRGRCRCGSRLGFRVGWQWQHGGVVVLAKQVGHGGFGTRGRRGRGGLFR